MSQVNIINFYLASNTCLCLAINTKPKKLKHKLSSIKYVNIRYTMDLFEQHILSAPIDQATDNVIKLMMATDAIRKELDYISELMCSGRMGDARIADLEQNSLKLLARLSDYQQAIRLGETYCGMKRRKETI